jgi:uncharacterized protein (TIGR02452 family)
LIDFRCSVTYFRRFVVSSCFSIIKMFEVHAQTVMSSLPKHVGRGTTLRKIAEDTLSAVESGFYLIDQVSYDLTPQIDLSKQQTVYYSPDSELSNWSTTSSLAECPSDAPTTEISILEISTLDGARHLSGISSTIVDQSNPIARSKIGILNFASAKNPGGGFIRGAQAQEESIARSSTLYPTLMTDTAQAFYNLHKRDSKGGYYSHAMIYSPHVLIFRDDNGGWTKPLEVDVLTSPAVNAGVARRTLHGVVGGQAEEGRIEKAMRERMARILFLFEKQETKNIVLGSFGTGVFRNDVGMVARIWADLLAVREARFKNTFDRVVFAIIGRKTFEEFKDAFEQQVKGDAGA